MDQVDYSFSVDGVEPAKVGQQFIHFFKKAVKLNKKSEEEGRPIFEERDYISIAQPGGKSEFVGQVTEHQKKLYPKEWQAYLAGKERAVIGTPVEEWSFLDTAQVAVLKSLSIHSVEQLSECDDNALSKIGMGARELKNKAVSWLKAAKDTGFVTKLQGENDQLKVEVDRLKQQVKEIAAQVAKKN